MFAILGAAGNVGFATSKTLRAAGLPVRAILHNESKAPRLLKIGCQVATADLYDSVALARAIGDADVVQIILPAAPQVLDTAGHMRRGIVSLHNALEMAKPGRVLVISDYGAHVADDIGMPSIFHDLEKKLSQLEGHKIFLRSAEHMQGWGRAVPKAMETGTLQSFNASTETLQPAISALDLGEISAKLLLQPSAVQNHTEIIHAEGPQRYSAKDLASAASHLAGRAISVDLSPRSQWQSIFEESMNQSLADLLIKTNDAKNKGGLVDVEPGCEEVIFGSTSLVDALRPLITQG